MHDPNKTIIFIHHSEAEILKIQENALPENTKKATKSVVEITE